VFGKKEGGEEEKLSNILLGGEEKKLSTYSYMLHMWPNRNIPLPTPRILLEATLALPTLEYEVYFAKKITQHSALSIAS
tara:strand:- start:1118 stop:1354 length:237 start_codon:yes stop_codon:yes gene_type:complete